MAELMNDVAMPTEIDTKEGISPGVYAVRIASAEAAVDDNNGKLKVSVEFRVTDTDMPNMPIWDRLYLGTDEDPMAQDPRTWTGPKPHRSFGCLRFAQLMQAAGVQNCGRLAANCAALAERQLSIRVVERQGKGEHAGQVYTNVSKFYPLGTVDSMRVEAQAQAPASNPRPLADTPMPQAGVRGGSFE